MKLFLLPLVILGGVVVVVIANRVDSMAVGVFLASTVLLGGLGVALMNKRIAAWTTADLALLTMRPFPQRDVRIATTVIGLLLVLRASVVLFNRLAIQP